MRSIKKQLRIKLVIKRIKADLYANTEQRL